MINGPSYYQYKLPRRSAPGGMHGQQEKFVGLGSFLAFFSARVLRGGPKALVQLTACFAAMVLLTKLLPGGRNYARGGWGWQKSGSGVDDDDDGSVPGGLRIVVFGESDVATPARLSDEDRESRSWTEILCEELNCTSYLSFVPSSPDPSRVMTSTELYATSVDRALNLTGESHGPGLDYTFMLDQFPIDWDATDLSRQIDAFLAMDKPRHPPAETLWVFSLGMWDVWSLASEPLAVSKNMVDAIVDHVFVQVERLYDSATDESSIAWSEPVNTTSSSSVETGLPTPTPDPETMRARMEEERDLEASKREPDETRHFRILVPRLFDPSLTPGWHGRGRDIPEVHSKAEQMRNAAVLTNRWNNKLYAATAQWIRTEKRRETLELASRQNVEGTGGEEMTALEILNGRVSMRELEARAKMLRVGVGGQNHVVPLPAQVKRSDEETEVKKEEGDEAAAEEDDEADAISGPPPQQRDGILYDINKYLEEVIVDRQLRNSGLRDARSAGMLTERGFREVWKPCVSEPEEDVMRERDDVDATSVVEEVEADSAVREGDVAYERKRDAAPEPAIRGRAAVSVAAEPSAPLAEETEARVCEDPDEHLFYTPLTVSPRAVAVIARQAADMVRRNETLRSGWASRHVPPLKYVGG